MQATQLLWLGDVLIECVLWSEKVHLSTLSLSSAESSGHSSLVSADLEREAPAVIVTGGRTEDVPLSIPAHEECDYEDHAETMPGSSAHF